MSVVVGRERIQDASGWIYKISPKTNHVHFFISSPHAVYFPFIYSLLMVFKGGFITK